MVVQRILRLKIDPPGPQTLRISFHLLWALDMCTAVLLILAPYASELNPVTVYFYGLFGFPGVALAACCYAAVVVGVGNYLSHPVDLLFLIAITALYIFFVFNNFIVLLYEDSIMERIWVVLSMR